MPQHPSRLRPPRSAASVEAQELKMTTVGGLLKEMAAAGGTLGMSPSGLAE